MLWSQLNISCIYIFLFEVHLEEKEEYKNYLRITTECFDELFVLVKNDITQEITNMRDASTPKGKLAAKIFHVHLFVVLFSYIFLLMWLFNF